MTNAALSKPPQAWLNIEPVVDHFCDPVDISDVWNVEIESDGDAEVFAYFDHNFDHGQNNPTLVGLSYNDGHGTIYGTATDAMCIMGKEMVIRLEQAYSEELAG